MNKPLRLLVDIDDTIEQLLVAWVDYLNNKYNLSVKVEDCNDWDTKLLFPTLTEEQICNALADTELWKSVQPIPYASETLKQLQDEGYEIVLVTASTYFNVHDKITYVVDRYFPFINHKNIIVAYRKQLINGDILIDDYINNLRGGSYRKILFTCYHNRNIEVDDDIIRVNNWKECYKVIHSITDELTQA